jgi:hypothetical protein
MEAAHSQQVKLDTTGPSVAITSPADGATVQGTVKVQAAAADSESGVASVTLYVDGTKVAVTTKSPYQFLLNTKKGSTGPHTLTAKAVDRAGNTTMSSAISVAISVMAAGLWVSSLVLVCVCWLVMGTTPIYGRDCKIVGWLAKQLHRDC